MPRCKPLEATAAAWLVFALAGCHQEPPPSLLFGAAIEAGAMHGEATASPQGAGMLAERMDLYFGQRYAPEQKALAAQPQAPAAPGVPTF